MLLAQLSLSILGGTDLWIPAEHPAAGSCMYEIFEDGVCLGTVFCDRPQSLEGMLQKLGHGRGGKLTGFDRPVPCGSSVWLSKNSTALTVRAITGGKLMAAGGKIDVNRAQASDLAWVSGIGPTLAERIVQEREHRNGFARLSDLRTIRGIGEKKWHALAQWLEIGPTVHRWHFRTPPDTVDQAPQRSVP